MVTLGGMDGDRDRLLTVKECARVLCYSPRSVYRLVERGELPAVRIGSGPKAAIRVLPEDLAAVTRPSGSGETR